MKAVILAAGRGSRMNYLTATTPKPMLKIGNKTLLEYKLDALPAEIDEIVIIVGYRGEEIRSHFGEIYNGKNISYVDQPEPHGSGDALWRAKELLTDRFLVMNGDDLFSPESIKELIRFPQAIVVKKSPQFKEAGSVIQTEDGYLDSIRFSRPENAGFIYEDTSLYALTPDIFNVELVKKDDHEWSLPHTISAAAHRLHIKVVETHFWMKINTPQDLAFAEKMLQT